MYRKVKCVEWISFKSAVSGRAQPVGWRSSVHLPQQRASCVRACALYITYIKQREEHRCDVPPFLVTRLGFEPKTPSLKVKCSTY